MQTHVITFAGDQQNEFGLPEPFHFYGVIVSPHSSGNGRYAVSVLSVSRGNPLDAEGTEIVQASSDEAALEIALNKLRAHPSHAGLVVQEGSLPSLAR